MATRSKYSSADPDAKDVSIVVQEIAREFHLAVRFEVTVSTEDVTVIGRCYRIGGPNAGMVECQALSRRRLSDKRARDMQLYTVAFDLYQQLDTGILGFHVKDRG